MFPFGDVIMCLWNLIQNKKLFSKDNIPNAVCKMKATQNEWCIGTYYTVLRDISNHIMDIF